MCYTVPDEFVVVGAWLLFDYRDSLKLAKKSHPGQVRGSLRGVCYSEQVHAMPKLLHILKVRYSTKSHNFVNLSTIHTHWLCGVCEH